MHILLLEPDRLLAQTYIKYLERAGHSLSLASDAQSGIIAADENVPDIVVMELQLARHNGFEFLYELRSYAEWQNLPVILHTLVGPANLEPSRELLKQLGVKAYLYKPVTTLQSLRRTIEEIKSEFDYASARHYNRDSSQPHRLSGS